MANTEPSGEHGSVTGQIERLTSGSGSGLLTLRDHPYYGSLAVARDMNDIAIGRRFCSEGPRGENGIFELVDVISLNNDGLVAVRTLDANALPLSIEIAFAGENAGFGDKPGKLLSMTIYLNHLGGVMAVIPVQNGPLVSKELTDLFDARLQDWGIETAHDPLIPVAYADARLNVRWAGRITASLSVLA